MGVLNILKKLFSKENKIVVAGLDNAGKTTFISFLKNGTFIEHTPTMGKEQTTMEVQGVRMNIMDLGGQKDFRSLWLGEMEDADVIIYMIDAAAPERFKEAKKELWKFSSLCEKKPLILLANKWDLSEVSSLGDIIEALNLNKLSSFQIFPVSCKTGYGIVSAFMKIYHKLTGQELTKKVIPKALTIFDNSGIPLTTKEGEYCTDDVLRGGLFAAITNFVKESFKSELNQLKLDGNIILLKKSKNFMGTLILDDVNNLDLTEAEVGLNELLNHLENMCCQEVEENRLNPEKVDFLVQQFSTNLFQ